jgi:hypothetical protein
MLYPANPLRSSIRSLALVAAAALTVAACDGRPDADADSTRLQARSDHPYFPLRPGSLALYEGEHDGQRRREEVYTADTMRLITGVACTPIVQHVYLAEHLSEVTTEWYARDLDGNVWKFGEQSFTRQGVGDELSPTADSWIAGVDGAFPWIEFHASPQPGDHYVGFKPGGQDQYLVAAIDSVAMVTAGVFAGCLELHENPDDPEDGDIILYAPGMGRVLERNAAGHSELVSVQRR